MRLSKITVNKHLRKEIYHTLHQLLSEFKKPQEVEVFLQAFLSSAEHETLAKRLAVAYWLDSGRGYNNIRENIKVSSATIANIAETYKKHPGAKLAIHHLRADRWANVWSERIKGVGNGKIPHVK